MLTLLLQKYFDFDTSLKQDTRNAIQFEWVPSSRKSISRSVKFVKVWEIDENEVRHLMLRSRSQASLFAHGRTSMLHERVFTFTQTNCQTFSG